MTSPEVHRLNITAFSVEQDGDNGVAIQEGLELSPGDEGTFIDLHRSLWLPAPDIAAPLLDLDADAAQHARRYNHGRLLAGSLALEDDHPIYHLQLGREEGVVGLPSDQAIGSAVLLAMLDNSHDFSLLKPSREASTRTRILESSEIYNGTIPGTAFLILLSKGIEMRVASGLGTSMRIFSLNFNPELDTINVLDIGSEPEEEDFDDEGEQGGGSDREPIHPIKPTGNLDAAAERPITEEHELVSAIGSPIH
ncbi:MAG: hypothetical protein ACHQT9_03190 [Candidatus Saccharimonadales bacterium]